ncbi:MAG: hypothetical protein CMN30_07205 [Sandaracinus sp.]|nr:hypothetical protein [Sandaracinus sp.]
MTQSKLVRAVLAWAALTALGSLAVWATTHISPAEPPADDLSAWALDRLDAARGGTDGATAPGQYTAEGPVVVIAWGRGGILARHVGDEDLVQTVENAVAVFARHLDGDPDWGASAETPVRFTVEVPVGEARLLPAFPYLRELSLVPRLEGVIARHGDDVALVTPEELLSYGAYDSGIPTPVPDLGLGAPVDAIIGRLARDLGRDADEVTVRRFRSLTLQRATYPNTETEPTEELLRRASVEGAEFLLRHQHADGTWTYVYDGSTDHDRPGGYNIPRHSGTTYFIAQVDRYVGMPEAREGALAALRWLQRTRVAQCGDNPCVVDHGRVDVGSAALTVVAATEVLAKEDHPLARRLAEGLTGFLIAQQREDGELMHEYDVRGQAPIDVQHMYYSGEAAFALLKAHEVLGDERALEAAEKLMQHLTGAGWDFLGSRYYYGEEHWTCIAAGEARGRIDLPEAVDFCRRWYEWNDGLQYREGDTPWPVAGAFGVGPVVVPRLTPVGSRSEAFVGTYLLMKHHGMDTAGVRGVVERGLGQLLRWRWAPGPTHHFANPAAARGGMPGSPVDLTSRNDFVQHAGSAWIRWAEVLREEREAGE